MVDNISFDILIFGIGIGLYDVIISKKLQIQKYKEEIDDYREWNEKEASYRIYGILKRLFKLKQYDVDLSRCYFENITFSKNIFETFDFHKVNLTESIFVNCGLFKANFDNIQSLIIDNLYSYFSGPSINVICSTARFKIKHMETYIFFTVSCQKPISTIQN